MEFNKENAGYTVIQYYVVDGKHYSTVETNQVWSKPNEETSEDLSQARECLSKIFNCKITNTEV